MSGKIQESLATREAAAPAAAAKKSVGALLNAMLDGEGYRKRFDELLGSRAPQFISSIVTLANADKNLQRAVVDSPVTVIQAALKAATYDLPIDPGLGYAYIVPFNNTKDGNTKMEATFIMGYKGMNQLALRTGVYETINVVDVREGELKSYNRLTEEINIEFIEDDEVRDTLPIIGWCGYFKLINGTKKTVYMTKKQIEAHEKRHRKGKYMGKVWREDFDAMAMKTVFRNLIGKWGLMSIDYQKADKATIAAADAIAKGQFDDEDNADMPDVIESEYSVVDDEDGDMPDFLRESEHGKAEEGSSN